jgi:hypothetical protein
MGLPSNKHNFWEAHPEGISLRNWFKTYIRRIFLLDEAMFLLMGKIEGKTEGKPFFFFRMVVNTTDSRLRVGVPSKQSIQSSQATKEGKENFQSLTSISSDVAFGL